ncbi:polysaccharide deacetylase family protein [Lentibacter algarum]|uniref:polysaccharide deacetylase family protein n=1 Tax=Lentibacter algarum TaxID=576131 RepID=UPI001C09E19A|nr:polysaccharide deacetylase family protein [Lentibacter algarum]MBU2983397.1 polysaccharide deacetylase family protein [Lentibacter algarum]
MNKLFLSIDFEDFSHDLGRDLGLWITRPLRIKALTDAYAAIEAFLQSHNAARVTFFCTGIIAEQAPELIARIASDGHEIACHYHFHDCVDSHTPAQFEANLATALKALRAASGQPVTGFRAPKFRIPQDRPEYYNVLARHVAYDSSFLCRTKAQATAFAASLDAPLSILPIYSSRLRLGGSYTKLFPRFVTAKMIANARTGGLTPHIYLHPYEFVAEGSFVLSQQELAPLGFAKAAYWHARQAQWHRVGNRGLAAKLSHFGNSHGFGGRLQDGLQALTA